MGEEDESSWYALTEIVSETHDSIRLEETDTGLMYWGKVGNQDTELAQDVLKDMLPFLEGLAPLFLKYSITTKTDGFDIYD